MPRCSPRSRETAPLTAAALHGTARLTGEQEKNDQIARAEVAGRNLARPLTRPTSISVRGLSRRLAAVPAGGERMAKEWVVVPGRAPGNPRCCKNCTTRPGTGTVGK